MMMMTTRSSMSVNPSSPRRSLPTALPFDWLETSCLLIGLAELGLKG